MCSVINFAESSKRWTLRDLGGHMNGPRGTQGPKRTPTRITYPGESIRTRSSLNQEEHPSASLSDLATEERQTYTKPTFITTWLHTLAGCKPDVSPIRGGFMNRCGNWQKLWGKGESQCPVGMGRNRLLGYSEIAAGGGREGKKSKKVSCRSGAASWIGSDHQS